MDTKRIKQLENIIKNYGDDPARASTVEKATKQIAALKGEKVVEEVEEVVVGDCPEAIIEALAQIDSAISLMEEGAGIDEDELTALLRKWKVNIPNLGDDVIELIESEKILRVEDIPTGKISEVGTVPPLFYKISSDLHSRNNVYLYGGAGTGKTHIAKAVAKSLNCTMITINCNQYTSPLEIQGGQTIDGYQQGKLIVAWGNLKSNILEGVKAGMEEGKTGCLLLLDELTKIDPNTAGILNDALAKVKNAPDDSEIEDSRGVKFKKANFYCIATGNIQLNKESTDYVANFQQDLSLQDRFVGSTYLVFGDIPVWLKLMSLRGEDGAVQKYTFIFNYCIKLMNLINSPEGENRGLGSQAFVSIRIMQSYRDTWIYWYKNHKITPESKTLQEGVMSFMNLFDEEGKKWLEENSDMVGFFTEVKEMGSQPLGHETDNQKNVANELIADWREKNKDKIE